MDQFIAELMKILEPVVVAALIALITKVVQRVGISQSAARDAQIEFVAKQAALYAEEYAADFLRRYNQQLEPAKKLEMATRRVLDKIPHVDAAEAETIVKAVLPQLGLGASQGAILLGKAVTSRPTPVTPAS